MALQLPIQTLPAISLKTWRDSMPTWSIEGGAVWFRANRGDASGSDASTCTFDLVPRPGPSDAVAQQGQQPEQPAPNGKTPLDASMMFAQTAPLEARPSNRADLNPAAETPRTARILVVDDNLPVAQLLADVLSRQGHTAVAVGSADEALAAAADVEFDLLLADLIMPGQDGWQLLNELRKRSSIRAIAVSALSAPEHRAMSRAAGYAIHLPKPVDMDVMLEAVKTVLQSDIN
jgi:CheY-like chemotaxis protein